MLRDVFFEELLAASVVGAQNQRPLTVVQVQILDPGFETAFLARALDDAKRASLCVGGGIDSVDR